jgi:hypothetical protein
MENSGMNVQCNPHPDAPHGFLRDASHNADRYVCECEFWEPPKREWVGLTEPELHEINPTWPAPGQHWDYKDVLAFVRAVEAKLKEKNQ